MALLIDEPRWPAHGRLWAHLVSDTSLVELHDFARGAAVPEGSFDGDHYDVPAERHPDVVRAGARVVTGRELVAALQGSGLRMPKRRGERVLATWVDPPWPNPASLDWPWPDPRWLRAGGGHRVDCIASPLAPPGPVLQRWLLSLDDEGRLGLDGDRLPPAGAADVHCGYLRIRPADAPWSYVALHTQGPGAVGPGAVGPGAVGPGAVGPGAVGPGVPLELVRGVHGQEYWWPLLLHLRSSRHR